MARHLSRRPPVSTVHYPGLAVHPRRARGHEWMCGFGGVATFEVTDELATAIKARARTPTRSTYWDRLLVKQPTGPEKATTPEYGSTRMAPGVLPAAPAGRQRRLVMAAAPAPAR